MRELEHNHANIYCSFFVHFAYQSFSLYLLQYIAQDPDFNYCSSAFFYFSEDKLKQPRFFHKGENPQIRIIM